MNYFNEEVKARLAAEGIRLSPLEMQYYGQISERANKLSYQYKTKKDREKGLRYSLWHINESNSSSGMSHWLVLPGRGGWKTKGKDVVTKLVVNILTGQKMFLKIRRPNSILQTEHLQRSRSEAMNNRLMNSPAEHLTRYTLGSGTKAYLFQRYRGDLSLQNIIDDPSSSAQKIVNILLASGDALNAMHARGYLHTDFKPHNIVFNDADHTLTLVDLEFMLSIEAGAAGVKQFAGTAPFQHADWKRESMRNFHGGLGVKYTPKNDTYAFLVSADICLGTAYSHANESYRKRLAPAWVQVRQWKDLPYAQMPALSEVMDTLNQLLMNKPLNLIPAEPVDDCYPKRSFRMK